MGLVMSMTIAGSIIAVAYLLLKPLLKKFFSSKFRSYILRISIIFYLFPFQIGKKHYLEFFNIFSSTNKNEKIFYLPRNIIQITSTGELDFAKIKLRVLVFAVWAFVGIVIICFGLFTYMKQKNQIIKKSRVIINQDVISSVEMIKKRLRIKRKVYCRTYPTCNAPLSVGIIVPVILLPTNDKLSKEENDFIYEHELLHIKNFDTLFRILSLIAIGINWFNPLVYYLFTELNILNENACDETIVLTLEKERRISYGDLILNMLSEKKITQPIFVETFSNCYKQAEERIILMLNTKKKKMGIKIISTLILLFLGMTSSLTVFAYEQPVILIDKSDNVLTDDENVEEAEAKFADAEADVAYTDGGELSIFFSEPNEKNEMHMENYFQNESGDIFISNNNNIQTKCAHTYVDGTYNEHIKRGNGCSVYVYKAQRCSRCGGIIKGVLDNKIDYARCTH